MHGSGGKPKRILIAAGGTGGHIFPALAVWDIIYGRHPEIELTWLGSSHRMESELIPSRRIDFVGLRQTEIRRKPTPGNILYNIRTLWYLVKSVFQSIGLVRKLRPKLVLATGGFAAGAAGIAARMTGTPLVIIEPNAYPGLTNRHLGKAAAKIFIAFDETGKFFREDRTHMVGVPVRREIIEMDREEARRTLEVPEGTLLVLALGGSQGAAGINKNMYNAALQVAIENPDLAYRIVHQCGRGKKPLVRTDPNALRAGNYRIIEFIEDIPLYLAAADVVVSRAGAGILSELACRGLPAVLIPYPQSAENHQVKNARSREEAGAAICIEEKVLSAASLADALLELLSDTNKRLAMGHSAGKFGNPDAADRIADLLQEFLID